MFHVIVDIVLISLIEIVYVVKLNVCIRFCDSFFVWAHSLSIPLALTITHAHSHSFTQNKRLKPFMNRVCWCRSCRRRDRYRIFFACDFASRDEGHWCTILIYIFFLLCVTASSSRRSLRFIAVVSLIYSYVYLRRFVAQAGLCEPLLASLLIFLFTLTENYKIKKIIIIR